MRNTVKLFAHSNLRGDNKRHKMLGRYILRKNGNDFFFSFFWVKKQFETKRMNTSQLDKAGERGERREERWGGEDYKQKESLPPFIDSTNSDRASAVLNEESTNPAFLGLPF